jgi:peptidoglycan/xylan/chitin deacetylase (PgdA/CDA1 family)
MTSDQQDASQRRLSACVDPAALILSYHRVNYPQVVDTWALSVSPELFFEHMRELRAIARPCSLTEIATGLIRGRLPENAVAVTFDDGYLDNLQNAKPILQKFEIPATVFVCSGWIGRDDEFWWDQLERALLLTKELPNRLELSVNGQHLEWEMLSDGNRGNHRAFPNVQHPHHDFPSRQKLLYDVWNVLRQLPQHSQIEAVQKITAWADAPSEPRQGYRPMNARELMEIAAGGLVEIGSHTVSHPLLHAHPPTLQRSEIMDGKSQLERMLGISIDTFAYPYGEFDQVSLNVVQEAQFLCACTMADTVCTLGTPVYELPRMHVRNWSGQELTRTIANRLGLRKWSTTESSIRESEKRSFVPAGRTPTLAEGANSAGVKAGVSGGLSTAKVNFGDLSGALPLSDNWGFSRGTPIDRFFIEDFFARHQGDVRGHVLEIGDDTYTRKFGASRVSASDVLDVQSANPRASIIADLRAAPEIPSDTFDCIILTQVLVLIDDVEAALATVSRILKPGGVALITVPGIAQISSNPDEAALWSWSFYPRTFRNLLAKFFDSRKLVVEGIGNLKTSIGFLAGLAQHDLENDDFLLRDHRYPLIVAARAIKPGRVPQAGEEPPGLGNPASIGPDAGQ